MKPGDKWRRPVAKIAAAVASAIAPAKPAKPRERTGGYWPDDDLEELENPRPSRWLGRRRKDWLRR